MLSRLSAELMLITGLGAKVAAVALAAFTIAAGVIFHDFWAVDAAQYMNQFNHFMEIWRLPVAC